MIYHNKEELIATSESAKENELFTVHDSEGLRGLCKATKTEQLCALYDKGFTLQYGVNLFKKV